MIRTITDQVWPMKDLRLGSWIVSWHTGYSRLPFSSRSLGIAPLEVWGTGRVKSCFALHIWAAIKMRP